MVKHGKAICQDCCLFFHQTIAAAKLLYNLQCGGSLAQNCTLVEVPTHFGWSLLPFLDITHSCGIMMKIVALIQRQLCGAFRFYVRIRSWQYLTPTQYAGLRTRRWSSAYYQVWRLKRWGQRPCESDACPAILDFCLEIHSLAVLSQDQPLHFRRGWCCLLNATAIGWHHEHQRSMEIM